MTTNFEFNKLPLEKRIQKCKEQNLKHPNKVPIVIEQHIEKNLNNYYLFPKDKKVSSFIQIIRDKIKISSQHALFIHTLNNNLLPNDITMGEIYEKYKDPEDNFLKLVVSAEHTFG